MSPRPFIFSNKYNSYANLISVAAHTPAISLQADSNQEFERLMLDELMDICNKLPKGQNKDRLDSLIAIVKLYLHSR